MRRTDASIPRGGNRPGACDRRGPTGPGILRRAMGLGPVIAGSLLLSASAAARPQAAEPQAAGPQAAGLDVPPTQEARLPQEGTAQKAPRKERARKRIVRVRSGGFLRGPSRPTENGGWEVKLRSGWKDLPASAVRDVRLESEVLDEFKRRRKALTDRQRRGAAAAGKARGAEDRSPSEAETAADLLEWTLDAGLLKEGFELGDSLLAEYPHDTDLRGVCANAGRFVAGLPERGAEGELRALLDLGGSGSRLVREVVVERLVTAAPRAGLVTALAAELKSKKAGRRALALMAYGRLLPDEDPRGLLIHSIYDPVEDARAVAGQSIGAVGVAVIGSPIVRALASESSHVRTRAAEALGHAADPIAVAPMIDRMYIYAAAPPPGRSSGGPPHAYLFVGRQSAYVQDFDVEIAQASSIADPVVNTLLTGAVLDVGVIGVDTLGSQTEVRAFNRALQRLTGANPGRTPKDWVRWWQSDASAPFRSAQEKGPETGTATR